MRHQPFLGCVVLSLLAVACASSLGQDVTVAPTGPVGSRTLGTAINSQPTFWGRMGHEV